MTKNAQKGLTLIEMMIAMVIGLLVVGTVITIFITNVRSNRDNVAMIKLNQELRGVMTFVSDELKRAGYSADPDNDAFIEQLNYDGASNCLRYSYDENSNDVQEADEQFGFQRVGNLLRWTNQVTSDTCAGAAWQSITDSDIAEMTDFSITEDAIPAPNPDINILQLTVSITGETTLSGGTLASRTLTEVIRLRNDKEI